MKHFYKYTSTQTAKIILRTRSLRYSSPLLFNDPFDNSQELRLDFEESELAEAVRARFADLIEAGREAEIRGRFTLDLGLSLIRRGLSRATPELRHDIAEEVRATPVLTESEGLRGLRQVWNSMVVNMRVFCVSESHTITPMWNHYADEYRGVVLELEASDEIGNDLITARKVRYLDPPAIATIEEWTDAILGLDGKQIEDLFRELQFTKHPDWEKEQEWRVVAAARHLNQQKTIDDWPLMDAREISAVYFGHRCKAEDQREIQALLSDGFDHVQCFRAKAGSTLTFEVCD